MATRPGSGTGAALVGLSLLAAVAVGSAALLADDTGSAAISSTPASRLASSLLLLCLVVSFTACLVLARAERSRALLGVALATSAACVTAWTVAVAGREGMGSMASAAPVLVPAIGSVAWSWLGRRREPAVLACWGAAILAAAVLLVGYDAYRDPACLSPCAPAWAPLARWAPASTWLVVSHALVVAACIAALYAVWRARTSTPPAVLITATWCLTAIGILSAASLVDHDDATLRAVQVPVQLGVATAMALAALGAGLRALRVAARLSRLVSAVEDPDRPLPTARGGRLQFATPGGAGWVEADGGPAVRVDDAVVLLRDESGPVVRVVGAPVDDGMRLGPWEIAALTSAREAALTRAHRRSLVESQRRVVETTDRERRRIEADLHDGAQQRLVSVKLHLALAARADPSSSVALLAAEREVQEAISALRELVHGGVPRTLETEGLTAALRDLAATSPVPIRLQAPATEPEPDGAVAVWSLVGTAVRLASDDGGPVDVVLESGEEFVARVTVPGMDAADGRDLALLRDRFGALGGHLTTRWDGSTGTITGVLPCV